ncbi:MAG: amidase [Gammaproteobacteria bacterium]|nr:amidase [Gammaproteobacteria bacterium]
MNSSSASPALVAQRSLRESSRGLADGTLSCEVLAADCIEQRQRFDPSLFAYHQYYDDQLLSSAAVASARLRQGGAPAVCGIPFSVKNVMAATGYACYPGTRVPAPARWQTDGEVVAGLRGQGALLTGTTHASELAVGGLGVNEHWGTPRNPWDAGGHRVPGGSSSGAAISVLQGACGFALGTDTGGSVRVPASAAGVVGLKTTTGRWPLSGVVPLASRFDTVGVFTRTVEDLVFVFEQIDSHFGHDAAELNLELTDFRFMRASAVCWSGLDEGIADAVEAALSLLAGAGVTLEDDNELFAEAASIRDRGPNTAAIECHRMIDAHLPDIRPHLSRHVASFLEGGLSVTEAQYQGRVETIKAWRNTVDKRLGEHDIVVLPTLRETPPLLDALDDPECYAHYSDSLLHNTVLGSVNGMCAVTVPVGLDAAGMPVGLQLAARANAEPMLLHVAALVEQVIGTATERCGYPPLLESLYNPPTS